MYSCRCASHRRTRTACIQACFATKTPSILVFLCLLSFPALRQTQAAQNDLLAPRVHAGFVRLRGNTRSEAKGANDRGRVDDAMSLSHLMLQLQRPAAREQEFEQFIKNIHDPASPLFHHWITAAEFGQRYGVPSADIGNARTGWSRRDSGSTSSIPIKCWLISPARRGRFARPSTRKSTTCASMANPTSRT